MARKKLNNEQIDLNSTNLEQINNFEGIEIADLFSNDLEKTRAKQLLDKYLKDYTIETVSDKNTLKQLIYLEIIHLRLQTSLNEIHDETQGTPADIVKTIHNNIEQITELKNKLGITKQKDSLNSKDPYSYLQLLTRKYKNWLAENSASRYMTCPHCGKSVLLKIKTDAWEAQKHPFFKDRILGNEHLITLYKSNKLSKDDLAKIFETSLDYVDWMIEKWMSSIGTN